ncbi:PAAR domain-containing protein [Neisseria sp. Dent CA1/247]|uniref:PAAR domain-containing protein n=1 Tax=Neisseria sp. Dent CA1/247 TaxID=2912675 RepID=UPI001FD19FA0|nr:PAAR domain-containing protein [Neisseria sp. Dent CA1/247]UOO77112.1 PAAR domain-containing protein [Neisseria sp. Dent CA1/247]
MTSRAIIRVGDRTTHGGRVMEGFENIIIYDKPAAGVGYTGYCPQCKTMFTIIQGSNKLFYLGKEIALEGMKTSCGAILIASQSQAYIDDETNNIQMMSATPPVENYTNKAEEKVKQIIELYWSYGEQQVRLDEFSKYYTDLNLHIITRNYLIGEPVEVTIKIDNEEDELSEQFTVTGIIGSDNCAVIKNIFDGKSIVI